MYWKLNKAHLHASQRFVLCNVQQVSVSNEKKVLRVMQTLHAEPKIYALPQTPFPGVQDGQNLISWRWSLPLPTNPVWWGSMQAISSYRGNRPTNTHTHKQTHRQDQLQYTVPLSLACSVIISLQRRVLQLLPHLLHSNYIQMKTTCF